jgi:hypothetical protein
MENVPIITMDVIRRANFTKPLKNTTVWRMTNERAINELLLRLRLGSKKGTIFQAVVLHESREERGIWQSHFPPRNLYAGNQNSD